MQRAFSAGCRFLNLRIGKKSFRVFTLRVTALCQLARQLTGLPPAGSTIV
jgi:hypothetical protein